MGPDALRSRRPSKTAVGRCSQKITVNIRCNSCRYRYWLPRWIVPSGDCLFDLPGSRTAGRGDIYASRRFSIYPGAAVIQGVPRNSGCIRETKTPPGFIDNRWAWDCPPATFRDCLPHRPTAGYTNDWLCQNLTSGPIRRTAIRTGRIQLFDGSGRTYRRCVADPKSCKTGFCIDWPPR